MTDENNNNNQNPQPNGGQQPPSSNQNLSVDELANLLQTSLTEINKLSEEIKTLKQENESLKNPKPQENKPQETQVNLTDLVSQLAQRLSVNTSSSEPNNTKPKTRSLNDIMNLYNK